MPAIKARRIVLSRSASVVAMPVRRRLQVQSERKQTRHATVLVRVLPLEPRRRHSASYSSARAD